MCHPSWARALTAAQRLDDLARLRRVGDRIDRDYAEPLDVETDATAGMPPCVAKQVTRPIRNREARVTEPRLA